MFAEVLVDIAHANVDRLFTYSIPADIPIVPGQRVLVPFGNGNKRTEGFVLGCKAEAPQTAMRIKAILRPMEHYPVLLADQIELAYWIRDTYHCLLADALRLMIPAQLRGSRVHEKIIQTLQLSPEVDVEAYQASLLTTEGKSRAPRQSEVLELMARVNTPMAVSEITDFLPSAASAIAALRKKGVLIAEGFSVYRDPYADIPVHKTAPIALNTAQRQACLAIEAGIRDQNGVFLLHGVTGSGKTEVYLHSIGKIVSAGGTAIVLVPEIALTPQTMDRFRARFGRSVAVLHSRLSAGERYDEWRRIRSGAVSVVVGARSAIFAPLQNLRFIVIDEEHEASYQSETTPRYSTVDVAAKRCRQNGAVLLLGSATPSLLSYYRAERGRYTLLELPKRVKDLPMPAVSIVDMRQEFAEGNNSIFSATLYSSLSACLAAGEQAILFINRRGYSTFVSCRGCGYVVKCQDCDVSMTYHKQEDRLKCHYCGRSMYVPKHCPDCGKPYLKYFGVGTQQVEEQLLKRFPGVTALRMDLDTTRGKNAHYEILSRFAAGGAQVLIGTQMVAKGLDISNVSLVGVIAADASLHIPDYRSAERTFQLLTQVAGRAGRDSRQGHVVVQTYTPEHPAIQLAATHDYKGFYDQEIALRKSALFPPFAVFVRLLFAGPDELSLAKTAEEFSKRAQMALEGAIKGEDGDLRQILFVFTSPAPMKRTKGQYRYQVLAKLARTKNTAAAVRALQDLAQEGTSDLLRAVEINPNNLF